MSDLLDPKSVERTTEQLDPRALLKQISGTGFYPVPLAPVKLLSLPPQTVPHDGISLGYTAEHMTHLHHLLSTRGHQRMLLRCILNRCDWDLIHNYVAAEAVNLSSYAPSVFAACLRLLAKVHEQRAWSDKALPYFQPGDLPTERLRAGIGDFSRPEN